MDHIGFRIVNLRWIKIVFLDQNHYFICGGGFDYAQLAG